MSFLIPLFFLFILSGASYRRFIDRRLQARIMDAQENEQTSVILLYDEKDTHLEEAIKEHGGKIKYRLDIIQGFAVDLPCKCVEKLVRIPGVTFIADDAKLSTLMDIARPTVGGTIAEESNLTGQGIGIAVLDTGVYPHADLSLGTNRIVAFKDFVNEKEFPYDDNGHGTHVAGIAAGNGYMSEGKYKGMAPKANILGVKVMDKNGSGTTSDIVAGMQWAWENRNRYNIRIVSLSIGSDPDLKAAEDPLVKGVEALWDGGIVVVTAAGNSGPGKRTINSPGISQKIITVGATDTRSTIDRKDDIIAKFSSRGPTGENILKPDIVAPGVNITSLNSDIDFIPEKSTKRYRFKKMTEPYKEMSGTSMATPIVSGAIALLLENQEQLTPDEVKAKLMDTAISVNDRDYAQGKGQINIGEIIKK